MDPNSPSRYLATELHRLRDESQPEVALSLVAPVFDELENLEPLHAQVTAALAGWDYELVLVDDGSRDGSADRIRELAARDPRVRGVYLAANRGQSTALAVGVHAAVGRLVATLDADLQNDPVDIPRLVEALGDHTAAVGYRRVRRDSTVRRLSSRIANGIRNRLTGDRIRDTGCSLKVFRARALRALPWFDGVHRFLPTLVRMQGGTVVEVPVGHHPRVAGVSKYGVRNRAMRALRDTFAIRWMSTRMISVDVAAIDPPRNDERVHELQPARPEPPATQSGRRSAEDARCPRA